MEHVPVPRRLIFRVKSDRPDQRYFVLLEITADLLFATGHITRDQGKRLLGLHKIANGAGACFDFVRRSDKREPDFPTIKAALLVDLKDKGRDDLADRLRGACDARRW